MASCWLSQGAFRSPTELAQAEAEGFSGLVGPLLLQEVLLQGAAQRALTTTASVLVVDLEVDALELESLYPLVDGGASDFVPFGESRGRSYWLLPSGVRTLRDVFVAVHGAPPAEGEPAVPGADRATPYQSADEGDPDGEAADVEGLAAEPDPAGPRPAEGLRGPPTRRAPAAAPQRAAGALSQAPGAPPLPVDDGAPMTRAEVIAEMRAMLAAQAATLAQAGAASSGAPLGAPTARPEVPQLFTDEVARLGLAPGSLDAILARAPVAPTRVQPRPLPPASAMVAAWGKARPARAPQALPAAPPPRVPPPPGLAAPALDAGFDEVVDEGAQPPPTEAPATSLDLALTCLREALQQGQVARPMHHPLLGALSDHAQGSAAAASDSSLGSPQMRGIARRREWQQTLVQHGPSIREMTKENLARASGVEVSALTPMAMYQYFRERSPLGADPRTHAMLTRFAWLAAEVRRAGEEGDAERVHTLLSRQYMFIDHLAGDRGYLEAAWFLTGLEAPPANATSQHTEREAQSPFSALADPRWLSAQGEYVKEMQAFRTRLDAERAATDPTPRVPRTSKVLKAPKAATKPTPPKASDKSKAAAE